MKIDQNKISELEISSSFRKWRATFGLAITVNLLMLTNFTLRWSDRMTGFIMGAFHLLFLFLPLFIYSVIWVILILGLIARFRPTWRNWGTAYAPAIALALLGIITFPSPAERFERITDVSFPEEVSNLKSWHEGGGFHDHEHTYHFITTPTETRRLIEELQMEQIFSEDLDFFPTESCPSEVSDWSKPHYFRAVTEEPWFYYLVTDEAHERVFIVLNSI